MRESLVEKGFVILLAGLFIGVNILPSVGVKGDTLGNTIYVDDDNTDGPWDGSLEHPYQHIQDAIDNVSEGDTIFVWRGFYEENLIVDKGIQLIGEERNTTVIDGGGEGDVVRITGDGVTFSGFMIQNSGGAEFDFGVEVCSDGNRISGNVIRNNGGLDFWFCGGVFLMNASYNEIDDNLICSNDREGIYMDKADYNTLHNNTIYGNDYFAVIVNASSYNVIRDNDMFENYVGMSFWPFSHDNEIRGNTIHDHDYYSLSFYTLSDDNLVCYNNFSDNIEWSIRIAGANNNLIEYNRISGSSGGSWGYGYGIRLEYAFRNIIRYNNIMNNKDNARILNAFNNHWVGNYWDDYTGFGPEIIWGEIVFPQLPGFHVPWVNFDWYPAEKPIEGSS